MPNREPNPFGSLRALFASALLQFLPFPLAANSICGSFLIFQHGLGDVARRGHTLVSCEIDRGMRNAANSPLAKCLNPLRWVLAGLIAVAFVRVSIPQFAGIDGRLAMAPCSFAA